MPKKRTDQNKTPHTQVPNLLQDFIKPLLKPAESACIDYIVRRTYGFAAPGGGRKEHDRISLSQFENGITSGKHVLDLGTGLKNRSSITKALKGLEEKGLIEVTYSCGKCLWRQPETAPAPSGGKCPRCARSCQKEYGLAPLSAKKIIAFLDTHDTENRRWAFDTDAWHFYPIGEGEPEEEVEYDIEEYGTKLWYRSIIDKAISELNAVRSESSRMKSMTNKQIVEHFYKPILELQELSSADPSALKQALERTIYDYKAHLRSRNKQPPYRTWHRLTRAIVTSNQGLNENMRKLNKKPQGGVEQADRTARDLLKRSAELNMAGDHEAAREVLGEILSLSDTLSSGFKKSVELIDAHLKQAFKLGEVDYPASREAISPYDYMPEWSWPKHLHDNE